VKAQLIGRYEPAHRNRSDYWAVRYLEVNTHRWLIGRWVLLSPTVICFQQKEIIAYRKHAIDGDLRGVEDFFLDTSTWSIAFAVPDTGIGIHTLTSRALTIPP
jgi:hypothetical protein